MVDYYDWHNNRKVYLNYNILYEQIGKSKKIKIDHIEMARKEI